MPASALAKSHKQNQFRIWLIKLGVLRQTVRIIDFNPGCVTLMPDYLPPIKEEVNAFARIRLSVCLSVSKITQKCMHGFRWMLRVNRRQDMDELINFWARSGLLSPISYVLQRVILLRRENPTYRYWAPVAAATRGFKMVLFTASHGNNFVGGTCAPPSALLVDIFFSTTACAMELQNSWTSVLGCVRKVV